MHNMVVAEADQVQNLAATSSSTPKVNDFFVVPKGVAPRKREKARAAVRDKPSH